MCDVKQSFKVFQIRGEQEILVVEKSPDKYI